MSVFGEIEFPRYVYGTRETQKLQAIPLDARLDLPESDFSYLLQKWDQSFCVRDSFGASAESVRTLLDLTQSVRTLEHMNQSMASAVEAFDLQRDRPEPHEEASLMVAAAD